MIEAGQMKPYYKLLNLNEKTEYIHKLLKTDAEKKGIQLLIENSMPEEEAIVNSDESKLQYILKTLVNIAVNISNSGSITLGYKKIGNALEFFVNFIGKGIDQETLKIIFDRFRGGEILITNDSNVTGMGLFISKTFVEMLGGTIWVESVPEKGTKFFFTIPYET